MQGTPVDHDPPHPLPPTLLLATKTEQLAFCDLGFPKGAQVLVITPEQLLNLYR